MRLTQQELDALPAKTKKNPQVVALYLEHDFLIAYAKHTDLRVEQDGPAGAIGAVKDWERHGGLQFEFLRSQGLRFEDRFLEIGCGTGRLARKLVPYLDDSHYCGIDISQGAIDAATKLAADEGWRDKDPFFTTRFPPKLDWAQFDVAWAFSVFIHLPSDVVQTTMYEVARRLGPAGRFYFSYVPEKVDIRTGLKQFRHTEYTYVICAKNAGLSFDQVEEWNGEQRIAVATRLR